MKLKIKTTAAAVAMFAAVAGSVSFAQTVTYNPGDLVIGFQATLPGSTGSSQNFTFNVGSAAGYNNGVMPLGFDNPIANIGGQLSSVYGNDWFSRGDLNWGAVGLRELLPARPSSPITPIVDGDSRGVVYASRAATGIGGSTPWDAVSRNDAASLAINVNSFLEGNAVSGGFANQQAAAGTGGLGAVVSANLDNSWSSHNSNGYGFSFFNGGIEGSAYIGNLDEFVYLDIYRFTPDGVAPTWVVTLALDSFGNVYAVPEPSTYAALIGAAGLGLVLVRRARRNKAKA